MKKTVLLFILLFVAMPSFASDWFQIDEKTYVDGESIEQYKNQWGETQYDKYSFWIKSLNDKSERFTDLEKIYKKKIWYQMQNYVVDCNQRNIGVNEVVTYDPQNNVLGNYSPGYIEYTKIVPDSRGEAWYYLICKPKQFKKKYLSE